MVWNPFCDRSLARGCQHLIFEHFRNGPCVVAVPIAVSDRLPLLTPGIRPLCPVSTSAHHALCPVSTSAHHACNLLELKSLPQACVAKPPSLSMLTSRSSCLPVVGGCRFHRYTAKAHDATLDTTVSESQCAPTQTRDAPTQRPHATMHNRASMPTKTGFDDSRPSHGGSSVQCSAIGNGTHPENVWPDGKENSPSR